MGLRLALFIVSSGLLGLLIYWQRPQESSSQLEGNLVVFVLVNLIIVVLCVLAFLIGRNVVKLIFDRRRKILGSKLRLRLVVAFVGLTLVPTTILFVLASGLLTTAMEGWFSSQVESAVSGAVDVARHHYNLLRENSGRFADELRAKIDESPGLADNEAELAAALEIWRKERGLFSLRIINRRKKVVAEVHNAAAVIDNFSEPMPNHEAIEKALRKTSSIIPEKKDSGQFVRAYYPISYDHGPAVLMLSSRVDPELSHALDVVNDSYKEYEQLKLFKSPLKSGYVLTLTMITGLILFSAIWIGFYLAREIAVPIQRIAEGTTEVARGNYDFQIQASGDDEIGFLVKSFNRMTGDLKHSTQEVIRQKTYLETVLANLAVGVIGIDPRGVVTSINPAAMRLYELQDDARIVGRHIKDVLQPEHFEQIRAVMEAPVSSETEEDGQLARERELTLLSNGRELKILCTAGKIPGSEDAVRGTVLLFDDITELSKAQHMSAWREVARRIAHEIKNPLTPIQLSAQRLEKLAVASPGDPVVKECTQTIVENVDSIKRLANEFSNFARMPTAELQPGDLNALVADTIAYFAERHGRVVFQFIADSRLPEVHMDREQIRRMLINLVDNGVAAVEGATQGQKSADNGPRIVVRTRFNRTRKAAMLEVADNGPGISDGDKRRIFEPYFTTKKGGTGLGLAIVTSIITDHQGEIRVYDNEGGGTKFLVELPLEPGAVTQRRFATVPT